MMGIEVILITVALSAGLKFTTCTSVTVFVTGRFKVELVRFKALTGMVAVPMVPPARVSVPLVMLMVPVPAAVAIEMPFEQIAVPEMLRVPLAVPCDWFSSERPPSPEGFRPAGKT